MIRFKIDYGCEVYSSASSREVVNLESVSNEAMRIPSGRFRFTPLSSLQVITEEPPIQIGRDKLSLKCYYKMKTWLSIPSLQSMKPHMPIKNFLLRFQSESKKYIQNLTSKINASCQISHTLD